jgi:hypothetical protein
VTAPIADLVGSELVGLSGLETVFFVVGLLCVTPVVSAIAVLVSTAVLDVLKPRFVARATLGAAVLMSTALFGLTSLALVRVSTRPSIDCYLENSHAAGFEIPVSGVGVGDGGAGVFPPPSKGGHPTLHSRRRGSIETPWAISPSCTSAMVGSRAMSA